MKPTKITERNIMFSEPVWDDYGLNLGLILGVKHNFIIDTGLGSGSVQPILDYIGESDKPIIVVNTHYHWDHIWGNCVFENGTIIAHPLCIKKQDKLWKKTLRKHKKYRNGDTAKCIANTPLDGVMYFEEDGVIIFASPGHSADDISVYDMVDKVLYVGDNVGDSDEDILPSIGTDDETFRRLIKLYETYDFEVCISGHNTPQGRDVLARMAAALDEED